MGTLKFNSSKRKINSSHKRNPQHFTFSQTEELKTQIPKLNLDMIKIEENDETENDTRTKTLIFSQLKISQNET